MKKYFILVCAFLFGLSTRAQDISNTSLVFHFPLDTIIVGSGAIIGSSEYKGTVSCAGGLTTIKQASVYGGVSLCANRFGVANRACEFDGTTGFIDIPYTTGLGTGDFTISYWAYQDVTGGIVFSKDRCGVATGYSQFRLGLYANYLESTMAFLSYTPIKSEWQFYVLRKLNSTISLYVNGVLVASSTTATNTDNSYTYRIGARHHEVYADQGVNFFKGKVDDVRLYNRAISEEEIQVLYGKEKYGLMAYFPFDGDLQDHGPNKLAVTSNKVDSTSFDRVGHRASAASFDGSGGNNCQLLIANSQTSFNTLPLTISTWFKTNTKSAGTIISKYIASSSNGYQVTIEGGQLKVWYYKDEANCLPAYSHAPVMIDSNCWYHTTVVFNYSGLLVYLNGKQVATLAWRGTPQPTQSSVLLNIGHYASGGAFNGSLDELKFYNRTLSSDEIRDEYANGLIAYYPFNGSAKDESNHGADGTLIDNTKITPSPDRFGKPDSSYLFNGSFIEVADPTKNNLDSSFTIAAWVNSSSTKSSAIVSKYFWNTPTTGTNGYFLSMEDDNVNSDYDNLTLVTNVPTSDDYYKTNHRVPLNRWSFVCATYSKNGDLSIYMNDTLIYKKAKVKPSIYNNFKFYIGAYYETDGPFYGNIDDVRLYRRPLDSIEVSSLYHASGWMGREVQISCDKQHYCIGETAVLRISNTLPNTRVLWTCPDKSMQTTEQIKVKITASGWYKVKITNQLYSRTDSVYVEMYPVFVPQITAKEQIDGKYENSDKVICKNDSVCLFSTGDSLMWTNGVINNQAFSFDRSQTYIVTAYYGNKNECQSKASVSLSVTELSNILVVPQPDKICAGDSVHLFLQGAAQYFNNNQPAESKYFTLTSAGKNYIPVVGVDNNGCKHKDSVMVIVNELPQISLSDTITVCTGSQTVLNVPQYKTVWNKGVENGKLFLPLDSTYYTVQAINETTFCQSSDSVFIVMKDAVSTQKLEITCADSSLCLGDSVQLSISDAFTKTVWSTGQQTNSIWIKPTSSGSFSASGVESFGCRLSDVISITVNPLPQVTANHDTAMCYKSKFTPKAAGAKNYIWNNGAKDGEAITLTDSRVFSVVGADSNACSNIAQVHVTVLRPFNEQLKIVTYNTLGTGMLIAWTPTKAQRTAYYKLMRLNPYNKYDTIYTCTAQDRSLFLDQAVNPSEKPYTYKLMTVDSVCKNEAFSVSHTSILLTSSLSAESENMAILKWNQYIGLTSNEGTFYRIRVFDTNNKCIDSLDYENFGDWTYQYVYKKHQAGNKYRLSLQLRDTIFVGTLKTDSGPFSQSFSNMSEASLVDLAASNNAVNVIVYPNPANDELSISADERIESVAFIATDGRVVKQINSLGTAEPTVSVKDLAKGFYSMVVTTVKNTKTISFEVQ